ncbi:MAG TPA: DUF5941 domain-containing protein [Euzebyales bacterium]|nr:DUF5941 domain-containing protein [Euzebyales bacterium]
MTAPLVEYRDDGPIATSVRRAGTTRVGSLTLTGLGVLAGAAGLLVDGAATGPASYAGIGLFVVLATLGAAARRHVRVQWLVPPLLRLGEYMTVAVLARRVDATTTAVAFVLLGIVAFHHYDIVYRLRHQHTAPSPVVSQLCGGWEVRTIVVVLAAATGALLPTLAAMAAWCGVLYVTESVRSWVALALDSTAVAPVGTEFEEDAG